MATEGYSPLPGAVALMQSQTSDTTSGFQDWIGSDSTPADPLIASRGLAIGFALAGALWIGIGLAIGVI